MRAHIRDGIQTCSIRVTGAKQKHKNMKINQKNVQYWIVFGLYLSFSLIDIVLFLILTLILVAVAALGGLVYFLEQCSEGKINFEIDLLAPFKSRHKSPEEQDKEKK